MRRCPWILWLSALSPLAACAGAPPAAFDPEPLDALHDGPDLAWPAALAFDRSTTTEATIAVGDCAVYSVTIITPDGAESWFVRTSIAEHRPNAQGSATFSFEEYGTGPIEFDLDGTVRFHLQVFDTTGRTIGESITKRMPADVLTAGFAPLCKFAVEHGTGTERERHLAVRNLPPAERRAVLTATFAVELMIELVLGAEALAPLLERAVRRPSLLTVALNFAKGIQVAFQSKGTRRWHGKSPTDLAGAFVLPVEVRAFGERALIASLLIANGTDIPPATVGVASVAATHPDDERIQVRVRLQAIGQLQPPERARIAAKAVAER
ncbi:MAG: hypothetical protein NXI31_22465 [bacterium]|nr:hypothetical protein [bacterium]